MILNFTIGPSGIWAQQVAPEVATPPANSSQETNPQEKDSTSDKQPGHPRWTNSFSDDNPLIRFLSDQKQIWTSPARIRLEDTEWLVPVAAVSSGLFLTDESLNHSIPNNPARLHRFDQVRNGGVAALGAASAGFYLVSLKTHDPHQRETGLLAGEAILNSLIVTQGLKYVAGRERPDEAAGQGRFFQGGSSFPSNHSAAAWAAAGIIAHEYPGPLTKILAYGLAATVTFAGTAGKQHFPSDGLIGGGIGWLVAESVYRRHHNPDLGGSSWNSLRTIFHPDESGPNSFPGSSFVPLDSWVYPAFDRLAALGYVSAGYQGIKPWTREQCYQLLLDADESAGYGNSNHSNVDDQITELLLALHHEFSREESAHSGVNQSAEIESVYTRVLSASGSVLDDGFHFGQTIAYDFGRPFRQGTNLITGASASGTYGSLFFYVRGEYQQSPSSPALSNSEIQFIADRDHVTPPAATPFSSIHQFQLLDAYVGTNIHGLQVTFGNQSLSWGPGAGGSLLLSDNADPFPMLRLTPIAPVEIPYLSKILGPFHIEDFFGRLSGHPGSNEPWIYGQKVAFKPFRSLEFSYGRTTMIGGPIHPLTTGRFLNSFFGRVDSSTNSVPGDSRTSIDWTWRLPGMHDWVTFYGELENDDDLIPFQNLTKSVVRPGIYLPHLPFLPKWELHFEYTSSTVPGRASFQSHGGLNYWNLEYPAGYTNDGGLLGNVVGREGVTMQGWARYWMSSRRALDLSWKQSRVFDDYVPGGGKWQDYQAAYSITLHSGLYLKSSIQLEHIFSYPLLFAGSKNNVVASLELGFLPPWSHRKDSSSSSAAPQSNSSFEAGSR